MGKYQAYPEYRDGRHGLLAQIPAHWMTGQMKYGHNIVLGKMLQSDAKSPADKLLPYLRAANVNWGGVDLNDVKEMWFSPAERKSLKLKAGDVVISEGGDVGRSAVWQGELTECYFQNAINRARPKGAHSSHYLYYWMSFIKFAGFIDIICNKSTIAHYTAEKVQGTPFAFPPYDEQEQIAAFLDHETAKIDRLIARQVRLIELLKEKRKATISHAVTKGLNPDAPMKDSGVEWLGEVPAHWVVSQLKRFSTRVVVGIAEAATHAYVDEGVPILRATNVRIGKLIGDLLYLDPSYAAERASKRIKGGDLVTVRTGNAGVTAIVPDELDGCQCFTMLITTLKKSQSNRFLEYLINSPVAQSYFSVEGWGTAQINISVPILQNLPVAAPNLKEQESIAIELDKKVARIDELVCKSTIAINLLQEHRTALISAAVTGKIDVRGWQKPSTEPQAAATAACA